MSAKVDWTQIGTVPETVMKGSVADFLLWLQDTHGAQTPVSFFLDTNEIRVYQAEPSAGSPVTTLVTRGESELIDTLRHNLNRWPSFGATVSPVEVPPFIDAAYAAVRGTRETISGSFFPKGDIDPAVSVTLRAMKRGEPGRWEPKNKTAATF